MEIIQWQLGRRDSMTHEEIVPVFARLRLENIRITPQRKAILEYLSSVENHPTADEIYSKVVSRNPKISVATVYNTLNLFVKAGIIKEMTYGDDARRYDFDNGQHYHAVCVQCGKVVDLYYPVLEDVEMVAEKLTGFQVHGHRMEVFGLCPECQQKQKRV